MAQPTPPSHERARYVPIRRSPGAFAATDRPTHPPTWLQADSSGGRDGLIGTGAAYVLNYQIITSEGTIVASTVTYLLPVVAIILGVLVLGEQITLLVLAGIGLILAGGIDAKPHVNLIEPIRRN